MAKRDWQSLAKDRAAKKAVDMFVEDGMVIGVGTGSTVLKVLEHLQRKIQDGMNIEAVPSSHETRLVLTKYGIPLTSLDKHPELSLTIDGADEVDPKLNLIKGGGGALFREKIIAAAARKRVIVVDSSKLVPALGTNWPIPMEVHPFALGFVQRILKEHGISSTLRVSQQGKSGPVISDNGGLLVDGRIKPISPEDVNSVNEFFNGIPGLIEHGLFVRLTDHVIVGHKDKTQLLNASQDEK